MRWLCEGWIMLLSRCKGYVERLIGVHGTLYCFFRIAARRLYSLVLAFTPRGLARALDAIRPPVTFSASCGERSKPNLKSKLALERSFAVAFRLVGVERADIQ